MLFAYRDADTMHKVQINELDKLAESQQRVIRALERKLVGIVARALARLNATLEGQGGALLKPVTMSLFGILNWSYLWFRDDKPISRDALCAIGHASLRRRRSAADPPRLESALWRPRAGSIAPDAATRIGRVAPSDGVEVEFDLLRDRSRLARQHEAGLDLPGLQRIVDVHDHFALHHLAAAGAAHAALAGIGKLHALLVGRVDDVLVGLDVEVVGDAVEHAIDPGGGRSRSAALTTIGAGFGAPSVETARS